MLIRKYYSRLRILVSGAASRLLLSFSNLIVSLFVIRTQSVLFWGEVVYYLLILDLVFSVVNWGHSLYLVRQFSMRPADIREEFQKSFVSRFYVWELAAIIILFLPVPFQFRALMIVWSAGRFIYQAFDPIIQSERKFSLASLIELIGTLLIIVPFILFPFFQSLFPILVLFTLSFIFRAGVVMIYYLRYFGGFSFKIKFRDYLVPAFPFLMLTFSAMLQQRTDLYVVAFFLTPQETANYQVFLNLLLLSHVAASLLLSPFAKNIYRLPQRSFKQLERKFVASGLMLAFISIAVIYCLVVYIFKFQLPSNLYVIGYFYILMYYIYQVRNYAFMKAQKQKMVAIFSFAGFALNLGLSILLTPMFGLEGALLAGLFTQLLNAILHHTVPLSRSI